MENAPSILLVDDEPLIARVLKRIFDDQWEFTAVTTLAQAGDALSSAFFDVILCDLHLKQGTTFDFIEALQRDHPVQAERIIVLTGGALTNQTERFLAHTSLPVVYKPFEVPELLSTLKSLLNEASDAEQGSSP